MQYFPKQKVVLALVVSGLVLFTFILLVTMNTITNVSAVEANGVGVYWDSNCSNEVFSIDWSTLVPGSVKNITVYIRNEENEPIFLTRSTTNWNPSKAQSYLNLGWNYTYARAMNPGEALQITLTLSVSRYVEGISNFSFDIVISGNQGIPSDLDGDGVVSADDIIFGIGPALGSRPGDPNWNPDADFNGNGVVEIDDVIFIWGPNLGKHY